MNTKIIEEFQRLVDYHKSQGTNSFKNIVNADNKNHYLEKIEYTNKELKKNIEEFEKNSKNNDTNKLFKEYLAKQSQINKNKKTLEKQENNLEFIQTKQNNIVEQKETENMRTMIYGIIIGLSVLMIIIISVSILYYAK